MLQVVVSVEFPTQSWPPLEGAGFVQFLDLVIVPPAHVTPQGLHADHSVQLPSEIRDARVAVASKNILYTVIFGYYWVLHG